MDILICHYDTWLTTTEHPAVYLAAIRTLLPCLFLSCATVLLISVVCMRVCVCVCMTLVTPTHCYQSQLQTMLESHATKLTAVYYPLLSSS